jgi:hypothetical protein
LFFPNFEGNDFFAFTQISVERTLHKSEGADEGDLVGKNNNQTYQALVVVNGYKRKALKASTSREREREERKRGKEGI